MPTSKLHDYFQCDSRVEHSNSLDPLDAITSVSRKQVPRSAPGSLFAADRDASHAPRGKRVPRVWILISEIGGIPTVVFARQVTIVANGRLIVAEASNH